MRPRLASAGPSRASVSAPPPRVVRGLITLWAVGGWVGWLVMQLTSAGASLPRC